MFNLMTHEVDHQKMVVEKRKKNVRKLVGNAMAKVMEGAVEHQPRHPEQRAGIAHRIHRSRSKINPGRCSTATHRFSHRTRVLDQFACQRGMVGECRKTSGVGTSEGLPRSDH